MVVALSGVGYAAVVLPPKSVGTAQLKDNAVTSAKVMNRSLGAIDFRLGQLPAGKPGPTGRRDLRQGRQGASSQIANLIVCNSSTTPETIPAGSVFHYRLIFQG